MVPLDHGTSMGPIPGFADPMVAAHVAASGGATCLTAHRGLLPLLASEARSVGILMHLSASTDGATDPLDKRIVGSVEDALRMGADGVSVHVNVGAPTEARQLEEVGRIAGDCRAWGMPLVAMMYPRGPNVKDPHGPDAVAHAARLGAELGADLVKVPYTGAMATFGRVVEGCPAGILVAGGPPRATKNFIKDMAAARDAGAVGVSVGRNVLQAQHPVKALQALAAVFP